MRSFAILIDAGFARYKMRGDIPKDKQRDLCAADFQGLVDRICKEEPLKGHYLYRVFYYDAFPADGKIENPIDGSELDLSATEVAKKSKSLFEEIKKLPFFALRMGQTSLNAASWKLKKPKNILSYSGGSVRITAKDISPNITQKGVDMKIGLDMATLTLKKQVNIIVLVTGDSDFVPAIKLARTEGVQIFLVNFNKNIKPEMNEHVDLILDGVEAIASSS